MTAGTEEAFRSELIELLAGYLAGDRSLDDLLDWEAEYALADGVTEGLRSDLDLIALLADETQQGMRDDDELRDAAKRILAKTKRPPRTAIS